MIYLILFFILFHFILTLILILILIAKNFLLIENRKKKKNSIYLEMCINACSKDFLLKL